MIYEVMATTKTGVIKYYKEYKSPFVAFREANKLKMKFFEIAVVCEENNILYNINGDFFLNYDEPFTIEFTGEEKFFKNYKKVDYRRCASHG